MPRLNPIDPMHADARAKPLLDAVQKKLGPIPNMMKTMATSPAVLKEYLDFAGALGGAAIGARIEVDTRGKVTDGDVAALRDAGASDAEIAEVVAVAALNVFTNLFNNIAPTDVDFPRVSARLAAAASAAAGRDARVTAEFPETTPCMKPRLAAARTPLPPSSCEAGNPS